MNLSVCYFGIYNPDYSRNRILIKGLRQNGVNVLECNSRLLGVSKYFDLAKKHWKIRKQYDVMIVGFPGFQAMIFARFLTRKPLVFDGAVSIYEAAVVDIKKTKPRSIKALYYWLIDFMALHFADVILCGTLSHIEYAARKFFVPKGKFRRLIIGASEDIFYPVVKNGKKRDYFLVTFFGTFIPLHGIEHIVEAAKILENTNIHFVIIGGGQTKRKMLGMKKDLNLRKVTFMDALPQQSLRKEIGRADVCLGVFSTSPQAQKAIPNKIYECAAMRKAIITADTPAIWEVFTNEDLMLVKPGNAEELARAIMTLKRDMQRRRFLANNAYSKFKKYATSDILGKELRDMIIYVRNKRL